MRAWTLTDEMLYIRITGGEGKESVTVVLDQDYSSRVGICSSDGVVVGVGDGLSEA